MGDTPILLSISLLVSNRIDTIRNCMESLRPLLEELSSELIAVDTGSTDGSIEVVKEYTDQIVSFAWCDDFSAARNEGLKRASGKWFLFIDDDEWFDDATEIVEFFRSGEYEQYESAWYQVRNILEGGRVSDAYVGRMCTLRPNTRFRGPIHEMLSPMYEPIKYFDAFVHHRQKERHDPEEDKRHRQRNIALLRQELKKDPYNLRNLYHLAQEYEGEEEFEKQDAVCRLALNNPQEDPRTSRGLNWIMAARVRIRLAEDKYEEAIQIGEKIISKYQPYELCVAAIAMYLAKAGFLTENYAKAVEYAQLYFDMKELLEEQTELCNCQSSLALTKQHIDSYMDVVLQYGIQAGCQETDETCLKRLIAKLLLEKDNSAKEVFFLEECKKKFPAAEKLLLTILSQLSPEQYPLLKPYIGYNGVYYESQAGRLENLQEEYDRCIKVCFTEAVRYPQLFEVAAKHSLRQNTFLKEADREEWEYWLLSGTINFDIWFYEGLSRGLKETETDREETLFQLSYQVALERITLMKNHLENDDLEQLLRDYDRDGLNYFRQIYRAELFEPTRQMNLPRECRSLLLLEKAFLEEQNGNLKTSVALVKESLRLDTTFASALKEYLNTLSVRLAEQEKASCAQREFEELARTVRQAVDRLLEAGQEKEAVEVLKQYVTLCPNDERYATLLMKLEDRTAEMVH